MFNIGDRIELISCPKWKGVILSQKDGGYDFHYNILWNYPKDEIREDGKTTCEASYYGNQIRLVRKLTLEDVV